MDCFYSVLGLFPVDPLETYEDDLFDLLGSLPLEVASDILRLLPPKDLLSVVLVCRKWMEVCKSDIRLRKSIRCYLRKLRKNRFATIIKDEFGSRGVANIHNNRIAMKNISNFVSSSRLHIGSYNFDRVDKRQFQFAPYLKGNTGSKRELYNVITNDGGRKRLRL